LNTYISETTRAIYIKFGMNVHLCLALIKFVLLFATPLSASAIWKTNLKDLQDRFTFNASDMIFGSHVVQT